MNWPIGYAVGAIAALLICGLAVAHYGANVPGCFFPALIVTVVIVGRLAAWITARKE